MLSVRYERMVKKIARCNNVAMENGQKPNLNIAGQSTSCDGGARAEVGSSTSRPTTGKNRIIDYHQHLLRVDRETTQGLDQTD